MFPVNANSSQSILQNLQLSRSTLPEQLERESNLIQKALPVNGIVYSYDLRKAAISALNSSNIDVKPAVSNKVGTKCYIITLENEHRHIVEMSNDGYNVRVLGGEERTEVLSRYNTPPGTTSFKTILTAAGNFLNPVNTNNRYCISHQMAYKKTLENVALGAAKIERVLAERIISGGNKDENVLFVGCEDFFRGADIALNHCAPVGAVYKAINDYLVPLSQRYPNAIIAAGSIYISGPLSEEHRSSKDVKLIQDNQRIPLHSLVNFTANIMPVLRDGKLLALVRKGDHLKFKPNPNNNEKKLHAETYVLDRISNKPFAPGKLIVMNYREDNLDDLQDNQHKGTCFSGKTLLPGESESIEKYVLRHFDPMAKTLSSDIEKKLFSHEFVVNDEKFLAVICGEFRTVADGIPSEARSVALPHGEDIDNAVRYSYIIHPTVGGDIDKTLLSTTFHYVHSDFGNMNKMLSHAKEIDNSQQRYASSDDLVSFTYDKFA
ncbi:hypothetical protein [Erwinia mallotivora]|uniref:Uncharacterized protein n=1 Tax=Erwinia mallotivora TaxID=69222 RepID=A0A014M6B7_9GAMM|nr:hypothetical protein [Erwinia mallotivora]EXU77326.1 hypothetical protein BG55_00450 [Erwinia mallotivora]